MGKEVNVLGLFFDEPSKHWHFGAVLKAAGISKPQAALWLKRFAKAGIIVRTKQRRKQPYYVANTESPSYRVRKKLFALNQLEKQGFLSHLASLPKAKAVILFGSLSRWDWHKESDIDLFIYGESEGLDNERYRYKLHRPVEIFTCKDREAVQKFKPAFLKNVLEGYLVKGTLDFVGGKNA